MARNNRMELIERVQAAGTRIITQAHIVKAGRFRSGSAPSRNPKR
jgi:hypothetical protein